MDEELHHLHVAPQGCVNQRALAVLIQVIHLVTATWFVRESRLMNVAPPRGSTHLCSPAVKGSHDGHVPPRGCVAQRREAALRWSINRGAELKQQRHHVHVAQVGVYTQDGGVVQHLRTVVHISTSEHQQPAHLTTHANSVRLNSTGRG